LLLENHSIRLARNTGWLAAGGVVTALLVAGLTAVTVRLLGSAAFGELTLAVALTGVMLQLADFMGSGETGSAPLLHPAP
jgi:O-antigen/teichoic acid export membrane protein